MKKIILSAPILFLAMILCSTGCRSSSAATPRRVLPPAPYEMLDSGRLHIREDILKSLSFAKVVRDGIHARLHGSGQLTFATGGSYAARAPTASFVEHVNVAVGDRVEVGTPLATLQSSEVARMRGDIARLRVGLQAERDVIARTERLIAQGAASVAELVAARARSGTISADIQGLQGQLKALGAEIGSGPQFVLRANAAGNVLRRTIEPGERVSAEGDGAFLIGDPHAIVVTAAFPERDAPLLQPGLPCVGIVVSLGAAHFDGKVIQVVQAIDETTHMTTVVCRPNTMQPQWRARMVASVTIDIVGTEGISVPRTALLLRRDSPVVFVRRNDGTLERRNVEIGATVGDSIQILHGLSEHEEVVTENAVLFDSELDAVL